MDLEELFFRTYPTYQEAISSKGSETVARSEMISPPQRSNRNPSIEVFRYRTRVFKLKEFWSDKTRTQSHWKYILQPDS